MPGTVLFSFGFYCSACFEIQSDNFRALELNLYRLFVFNVNTVIFIIVNLLLSFSGAHNTKLADAAL